MPGAVIGGSVIGYRAVAAAYVGPGDVISGAIAWWGLRAYSNATIGANAVRLRRDSDNNEQDFSIVGGGGLDSLAISAFKGAANLFIVTLYDQIGSNSITQATAANQPEFILNGIGSLPVMRCLKATNQYLSGGSITESQPFTCSTVAKRTGDFSAYNSVGGANDGNISFGFALNPDSASIYAGGTGTFATATDSVMHAIQFVFNTTSSDLNVDGNFSASSVGTGNFSAMAFDYGRGGGNPMTGDSMEVGIWPSAFSTTDSSNMSTNQYSYWGV
jgi:hypothetical protein